MLQSEEKTRQRVVVKASAIIGDLEIQKLEEERTNTDENLPSKKPEWRQKRVIWSFTISTMTILTVIKWFAGGGFT